MVWLELLGKREVAADSANAPQQRANQAHIVMGEADFHVAIREALCNYTRPTALHSNPLLQTRLITERAGAAATASERVAALQALIQTACETLNATPREAKAYGAVYHTYLQPALTQEQAAELLDLPFSTFRRHLKNGIARISELLWQWELQGAAGVRSQESEIRRPN
jgi:DNA-directed RNA polymerase specialized sigma24 family protein